MSKEPNRSLSSIPRHGSTAIVGKTSTLARFDPANLPSLPGWLTSRLGMVSVKSWGKTSLPESQALSCQERLEVQLHLSILNGFLEHSSLNHPQTANEVLGAVTRLLLALPSKAAGEATGEAKAEAYMMALEDLPAWAVTAAVRRWYRGECGPNHNYTFAPAPATLRDISIAEKWKVQGRADKLKGLLDATLEPEFSEEHCEEMRGKLRDLFAKTATAAR